MHQTQSPDTGAAMLPPALFDAATRILDDDYALGCECADPSLQIERWSEFSAPAAGEAS